jgi:hypothetical protein
MPCKHLALDEVEAKKIAKPFEADLNHSFISVSIRLQDLEKLLELSTMTESETAANNLEEEIMWVHFSNFVMENSVRGRELLSCCNALDSGNIKLPSACRLLNLYQHAE